METIYFDHAATTPLHPAVREAMQPFLADQFGNPSSIHRFGRDIRVAVDRAREQVAHSLNTSPRHIVFTSGGTEADNLAIIGGIMANATDEKKHIVTTTIEHHAVLHTCRHLEALGYRVTYVSVDRYGMVHPEDIIQAITDETVLVSVMLANNEVGTIQPIEAIGKAVREKGCLFHTDAVQAYGSIPIDLETLPVDFLSISAHKVNGPKGIGALYIAPNVAIQAQQFGGTQEWSRRPGTENVPGIIGFGKAAELIGRTMAEKREQCENLRRHMLHIWDEAPIDYVVNGHPTHYLPHILNVSFIGVDTEIMLMNLDLAGVACASGSACTAGSLEVSHVLQAMQLADDITASAVRFSFGYGNTIEQAERAAETVIEIVNRLRC